MLNLRLIGIESPGSFENNMIESKSPKWVRWRWLRILDLDQNVEFPDWYFVGSCSTEYFKDTSPEEQKCLLPQDSFDEKALFKFALEKFNLLSFVDWEDFYTKMSDEFIYED